MEAMTEYHDKPCKFTKSDKKWHHQYEKLVDYKLKNGHCMVSKRIEQDNSLGRWVGVQRTFHRKNKMRPDRKDLLDELDFVWRVDTAGNQDKNWQQQYEKLVEFKRKNGHCIVRQTYEQDKTLGRWINDQRNCQRNHKMRPERKDLLDELEYVWRVDTAVNQDKNWHQQYEKLVEFKRKNGHCIVPRKYEENNSLGNWVDVQRKLHTKNEMRQDRKELLDKVEFFFGDLKSPTTTTRTGTSSMKSWSSLNERMVIVSYRGGTSKTRLLESE
jgi:uncharacterized protein YbgA (DUF1722 family)